MKPMLFLGWLRSEKRMIQASPINKLMLGFGSHLKDDQAAHIELQTAGHSHRVGFLLADEIDY